MFETVEKTHEKLETELMDAHYQGKKDVNTIIEHIVNLFSQRVSRIIRTYQIFSASTLVAYGYDKHYSETVANGIVMHYYPEIIPPPRPEFSPIFNKKYSSNIKSLTQNFLAKLKI